MWELSQEEYELWRSGAEVPASDQHGDKVLLLSDGTYLKLFRFKRLLSSARIFPYWRRFVRNAGRLRELGVPTLRVRNIYYIPHLARTAVHYDPLAGMTLRELTLNRAEVAHRMGCTGVVCSSQEVAYIRKKFEDDFLLITPGIRPEWSKITSDDQAHVSTPRTAISSGADLIVVGRPIYMDSDPRSAALRTLEEISRGLDDRK